jgi:hypothetical protein
MIKNEVLLSRMCKMVALTFAVPYEKVFEDAKQIGIEAVIELLENQITPKFN